VLVWTADYYDYHLFNIEKVAAPAGVVVVKVEGEAAVKAIVK